jgi:hypothetical protein
MKIQNIKLNLILALIFLLLQGALFSQEKEPIKVLFIGNSFTYFWNMPQLVNAIGEDKGVPMIVKQSTVGGSNLEQHWKEGKGTKTQRLLKEEKWDYVVIGAHSLSTIETPERFNEYGEKFVELIRSVGAEPFLYLTWAYKSNPLMQPEITNSYLKLAKELKVDVIPVGPIWMEARQLRPDLNMYFDDKHPSPDGSYLIGLIVYKALTGQSILDVPDRVTTFDKNNEKLYLSFVLPENGDFFRQLVEETDFGPYKNTR